METVTGSILLKRSVIMLSLKKEGFNKKVFDKPKSEKLFIFLLFKTCLYNIWVASDSFVILRYFLHRCGWNKELPVRDAKAK